MHCKICQSVLPDTLSLTVCPVCGEHLHPEREKPSFERTWAQMQAEALRNKASQQTFDEAWSWYQKAVLANPGEAVYAAAFLDAYPQFHANVSAFERGVQPEKGAEKTADEEGFNEMENLPASQKLLLWAAGRDSAAALQYAWRSEKPELVLALLNPADPQSAILQERLSRDYKKARRDLCRQLYPDQADAVIRFGSKKAIEAFSGLAMDEAGRSVQLEKAAANGDLSFFLDALYRPLEESENPFGHLNALSETMALFLSTHTEEWKEETLRLLESDQALRGIHLALQTVKNQFPALEKDCQPLLDKQYEKAYMRPFSQIEKTDHNWN